MIRYFSNQEVFAGRTVANPQWSGAWEDDQHSVIHLHEEEGTLAGSFSVDFKKDGTREEFPLSGFVHGEMLAFSVCFAPHGTLASFSGQLAGMGPRAALKVLWMLNEHVRDARNGTELVGAILTGSSEFHRLEDFQ